MGRVGQESRRKGTKGNQAFGFTIKIGGLNQPLFFLRADWPGRLHHGENGRR